MRPLRALSILPLFALALISCQDPPADNQQPCSSLGCPCEASAFCAPGLQCDLKTQTCTWSSDNTDTAETGEDPCPDGTLGCECAPEGCFPDPMEGPLECENGICVVDSCPDGTLGCECTATCLESLTCLDGVCVDLTEPACLEPYESCYDNGLGSLGDCCGGTMCIGYELTNLWGCAPTCTSHADCVTDCCVELDAFEDLYCSPTASNCVKCINTCQFAGDGACDDGGPGSQFSVCELGTDCTDCGPR